MAVRDNTIFTAENLLTGRTEIESTSGSKIDGTLKLKEQVAASTAEASYGQIWVKTATPNELYFQDDAGTDYQLTGNSGTYSPTFTSVSNLDATPTGNDAMYFRIGNIVHVAGNYSANPTSAGGAYQFRMSLPVASNFANTYELAGGTAPQADNTQSNRIIADTTNDEADFVVFPIGTGAEFHTFEFTYKVI